MRLYACVALCFVACTEKPSPPPATGKPGRTGTARLAGVVRYSGARPPPPRAHTVTPECRKNAPPPRESAVQVGQDGAVAEAFVWIRDGIPEGDYPLPPGPVFIDQRGCEYVPRVAGARVGQPIAFRSDDDVLHNVHALGRGSNQFNFGMPVKGLITKRVFAEPQVMVEIGCDVHPWMRAYVGVVRHPYFAVTSADGRYSFERLPAGSYVVEAWQEAVPRTSLQVTLAEGESKTADFVLHQ
jgi:hypothetical protein